MVWRRIICVSTLGEESAADAWDVGETHIMRLYIPGTDINRLCVLLHDVAPAIADDINKAGRKNAAPPTVMP